MKPMANEAAMARVELEDSWVVDDDVENVQTMLRKFLKKQGMAIVDESDRELHFEHGSFILTRLLGGWFVPAGWLPKKGTLVTKKTKTGVRVIATIEESIGFGFLDPLLKKKYERFFEEWMADLEELLDCE